MLDKSIFRNCLHCLKEFREPISRLSCKNNRGTRDGKYVYPNTSAVRFGCNTKMFDPTTKGKIKGDRTFAFHNAYRDANIRSISFLQ
jgi:hypothetical protein